MTIEALLMFVAFVLLVLAALGVGIQRVSLGWLGMALWALAVLLGSGALHG